MTELPPRRWANNRHQADLNGIIAVVTEVLNGEAGVQGPQGEPGPQGQQGWQGVQGPTGLQGPRGYQGDQGQQGWQGMQGPMGVQGLRGYQGDRGPQGSQGDQGLTGAQGPRGWQGDQGHQGVQGHQGSTGATGAQGDQGVSGQQGAQGTAGPQGAMGPQGESGAQGDQGVTGAQGERGEIGPQGQQGSTGAQGEQGQSGAQGQQGARGAQGETGPQGAVGAQGDQGVTGAQGDQGAAGAQGYQGAQGATGGTGEAGADGPQGPQGSAGAQGPSGAQGAQGQIGQQGPTGPQGDQGAKGAQGVTGAQGAQGQIGEQGPTGVQGDQGELGPTGAQGPQGEVGAQGPTGPQGDQGEKGAQGVTGAQGAQGQVGAQGSTGATGAQGPQGAQGSQGLLGDALASAVTIESGGHFMIGSGDLDDDLTGMLLNDQALIGQTTGADNLVLGNLRTRYGIGAQDAMGVGIGDYGTGNYLRYEPAGGFALRAGAGAIEVDDDGLGLQSATLLEKQRTLRFFIRDWAGDAVRQSASNGSGYADLGVLYAIAGAAGLQLRARRLQRFFNGAWHDTGSSLTIEAENVDSSKAGSSIRLEPSNSYNAGIIMQGAADTTYRERIDDSLLLTDDLVVRRNGADHIGYVYVPLATPATNADWDGDDKTSANRGVMDLSELYGIPAGVKAVNVFMLSYSTVAGRQCLLSTTSDLATLQLVQRHRTANLGYPHTAIVNCDANGDIYYWCDLNATFSTDIRILGYWI